MSLINLKRSKADKKKQESEYEVSGYSEDYGYGLRVSLADAEMTKLGLSSLKVGEDMKFSASAKIVSYSEEENGKRAELMITAMEVDTETSDREAIMYPDKG